MPPNQSGHPGYVRDGRREEEEEASLPELSLPLLWPEGASPISACGGGCTSR